MARAWMKAALAGMAIMAMTAPVHAADTIKIGVPGAHSGGILGKEIEIIAEDDQCKP